MFDVTSQSARQAVYSMSDFLGSVTDLREPMPSPNAANKSAAKKSPEKKGVELGARLARKRSQDFTSKIQGWNQSGAGVVQQHDEVVVIEERSEVSSKKEDVVEVLIEPTEVAEVVPDAPEDDKENEALATPDGSDSAGKADTKVVVSARTSKEVDLGRKAWVRRKSRAQAEVALEVKHAGTPKKRVISDGHWRRDRTAAKPETASPEKESTPKPVTIRRSVVSVGLKVPPSVQDFVEDGSPVKVRPLRQSHSRSPSRERDATPDYQDSGVKVYIKRHKRSKTFGAETDPTTSQSSLTAGCSVGRAASSTDITTPTQSPTKVTPPRPSTAPKEKPSRRSLDADREIRRVSRRKSKPAISDEDVKPKPASKPAAPVLPKVYGNRIEGWLAHTSDPFTDDTRKSSLTPEPLDVPRKKSRRALNDSEDDGEPRKSSGRRRRSRPSLERVETSKANDANDLSPSATPTLRRSGARRNTYSPVKVRSTREGSPLAHDADAATVISDADLRRKVSRRGASHGHPSGRRHLPTIASDETLQARRPRAPSDASEHPTMIPEGSVLSRASDGDEPRRQSSGLKRRLTKHSDLVSVLSGGQAGRTQSKRSVRSRRPLPERATIGDLMSELTTEELKYQRELRTLVDGVIPVLLTYVLQKTDATGAKRLFSGSSPDGQTVTRPIVEMGVALEKLKATHKRIPLHDPDELLRWAQTASNRYAEYLKAWRLGFQDVVVNLAPAEEDAGVQRKTTGDLRNTDGERADVQYLLKRPLVRLKYLTKTFRGINQLKPSQTASDMGDKFHDLIEEARQRANDERARLEDEAAASIDPSRARDPRSLAALADVFIDPTRSVRARDYFDLEVLHSSGQQLTCKVELIVRDDAPDRGTSSDVLFCEVSLAGRWLLFPPIPASYLSARDGDKEGEIIVMVRGTIAGGREWRELMSLQSDDEGAITEWLDMLGSKPMPPRLTRQSSFNTLKGPYMMSGGLSNKHTTALPPSPSGVDVPIGERANEAAEKWDGSEVNSTIGDLPPPTSLRRAKAKRYRSTPSSPITEDSYEQAYSRANRIAEQERYDDEPEQPIRSRYRERSKSSYVPAKSEYSSISGVSTPTKEYSVWLPSTDRGSDSSNSDGETHDAPIRSKRPSMHQRTSSVPSMEMPTVHKLRKAPPQTPRQIPGARRAESSSQEPTSAPAKLQKKRGTPEKEVAKKQAEEAATPRSRPTSLGLRSGILPSFTPAFLKRHRRASSPLKYEYEPSSASESLSETDSDLSAVNDIESVTSESDGDEIAISTLGEMRDFRSRGSLKPHGVPPTPPKSIFSAAGESVGPSESASQAPHRDGLPLATQPVKTVACIFSWSDRGTWDSLHPQECSIVVTPGLIEAFDVVQAHAVMSSSAGSEIASPSQRGVKPLVALELTPLVPLRRGTAVDISIRSPPTDKSLIRTGNNVMFRSRSPEECERLYFLINRARIDNPTFIAMQNARGPVPTSNWAEVMDKRNAARTSSGSTPSSWLRFGSRKGSTYRSNGTRAHSTAATESSVATMNTAFSALRRFSGGSNNNKSIFNIAKSTLTSREGTRSTYSDSLSSGAATPLPIDPSLGTPLGITNAKVRLYIRETASKWRDMGSARLSVLLPPRQPGAFADPRGAGIEKRILLCGKSKGETMLDVTLGESCFERVARTGIAMSVWEEAVGPNGEAVVGAAGGVSNSRSKIYMIQMKSERDAAYTFGLVGKLRY